MAVVTLTQSGTGNSNMCLRVTYTIYTGYVNISNLEGCRTDKYNTGDSNTTMCIANGSYTHNITAYSYQFPRNSAWKSWGNPRWNITTSSTSLTITFTFTSSTTNIKKSKFVMTVAVPQVVKPTVSAVTTSSTVIDSTTASFSVTNNGGGTITAQGLQLSATNFGTVLQTKTGTAGTFTGLSPNTTYYIRGYATNSAGTTYTSVKSVTTLNIAMLVSVPDNVNIYEPYTITFNRNGATTTEVGIYTPGSIPMAAYRTASGTSYQFNFTEEEIENFIDYIGKGNSDSLLVYVNTNSNAWRDSVSRTFVVPLPPNFVYIIRSNGNKDGPYPLKIVRDNGDTIEVSKNKINII